MRHTIGITQWQLPCPTEDCVRVAASLEMKTIQIDLGSSKEDYQLTRPSVQARLLADAEETGVKIVSVVLNDLCGHGFTGEDATVAYRTMSLGVETAAQMRVPSLCLPSFFDNAIRDELAFQKTVVSLQFICDLAEKAGIAVYTENVLEAPELARLFREVNRPNLRLLYDSQNYRQMANRDALPVFVSAASLVGDFLHVKDGDEKLGDRPLGEGICGLEKQLEAIVRSGFAGSYILENKFQTLDDVAECAARLDDLLDAAEARVHDEA